MWAELNDDMLYGHGGFDWMRTLLRLRDYSSGALMEEYRAQLPYRADLRYTPRESRMRITLFGRDYYAREWARYKALYPGVDAPQPHCSESPRPQNGNSEKVT